VRRALLRVDRPGSLSVAVDGGLSGPAAGFSPGWPNVTSTGRLGSAKAEVADRSVKSRLSDGLWPEGTASSNTTSNGRRAIETCRVKDFVSPTSRAGSGYQR